MSMCISTGLHVDWAEQMYQGTAGKNALLAKEDNTN